MLIKKPVASVQPYQYKEPVWDFACKFFIKLGLYMCRLLGPNGKEDRIVLLEEKNTILQLKI